MSCVVVSVSGSEPVFISVSYYRSFLLSPLSKSVNFEEWGVSCY